MRFKTAIPIALLFAAAQANAAEIVPATGKVVLAPDEGGVRFETGETSDVRLIVYDLQYARLTPEELAAHIIASEPDSIEGAGALEIGGDSTYALFDLRNIKERYQERRVELRFWQRTLGTRFAGLVSWYAGDVDAYLDRDDQTAVQAIAYLSFQPTGRATDDGWEEWTTGPFDFLLAHKVAPSAITFFDDSLGGVQAGLAQYDPAVRTRVDALSITDLGAAVVADAACTLPTRDQACGDNGTCYFGRCVDAAPITGPLVHNADLAKDYLDRYALIFNTFEGGRAPLAKGAALKTALDGLINETSARRFREAMAIAVHELGDGHASTPYTTYVPSPSSGVCAYIGDADLLPERAERPLVFDFDSTNPIGAQLAAGDVLTAIDGIPPRDWAVLARARLGYGGDPAGRETVEAASLFDAALEYGAKLSIARCPNMDTCTSDQVMNFDIELAALTAPIFYGEMLSWTRVARTCDFRFRRAIEGPTVRNYEFAGSADEDGARILMINGVPARQWQGGAEWFDAVDGALSDAPTAVILDERMGGGGSPDAVDRIAAYLVGSDEYFGAQLFPRVAQELTPEIHARFLACVQDPRVLGQCGDYQVWPLGFDNPNIGLIAGSKLAIVNGLDVSGNDFLPKMLSFRTHAETRVFGPSPTYGAFGSIVGLPALLGDLSGGSFQIQDTVFTADATSMDLTFSTSTGIPPDERLLQRQSDAVRGVDTVLEAAKAWVLQ